MPPRLVKCWPAGLGRFQLQLAVYTSPCIVTQPPPPPPPPPPLDAQRRRGLVCPANEQLQGTALPYFPMAGPPPKDLNTSNWGGMDIGSGMFYATQTVDGVVSRLGGAGLRELCAGMPVLHDEELLGGGGVATGGGTGLVRCPVGSAVITDAVGAELTAHFDTIVHCVPPLWTGVGGSQLDPDAAERLLQDSFAAAMRAGLAAGCNVLTIPLLGAGSRGAPVPIAIEAAAAAAAAAAAGDDALLLRANSNETAVAEFVVLEPAIAAGLVAAIDAHLERAAAAAAAAAG